MVLPGEQAAPTVDDWQEQLRAVASARLREYLLARERLDLARRARHVETIRIVDRLARSALARLEHALARLTNRWCEDRETGTRATYGPLDGVVLGAAYLKSGRKSLTARNPSMIASRSRKHL